MRAYFSATPHFGVLVPWWLALPLLFLWCSAAAAFWLFYAAGWTLLFIVLWARDGWRWWQARRHPA